MASPNDKPRGYFEKILAIDCETTGLNFNTNDCTEGHQPLSWGLVVADGQTLNPIEELYVEIKWNLQSLKAREQDPQFGKQAEKIHGLTLDYLEKNGIDESEAVEKIGNLIVKYWGPTVSIRTLGHNVSTFDMPFLRAMFQQHGINLRFGNRHFDTNSIAFATVGSYNSDDFFNIMGMEDRDVHNALEDAKMALECTRRIKLLWESKVGIIQTKE